MSDTNPLLTGCERASRAVITRVTWRKVLELVSLSLKVGSSSLGPLRVWRLVFMIIGKRCYGGG